MPPLVWDNTEDRRFETGIDRGVLYLDDGAVALPWNGLTSISEKFSETVRETYFFDGMKYFNVVEEGDFNGSIQAFTFPDQFMECDGSVFYLPGFSVKNQNAKPFSMTYRTLIGNADDGTDHGYKIHILYNLTAVPSGITNETLGDSPEPIEFEWDVVARPEPILNYRPTSHVIIDSTLMNDDILQYIEGLLYGDEGTEPSLPSLNFLVDLILYFASSLIVIEDNGDGTWSATGSPPFVAMVSDGIFQLTGVEGTYLTPDIYELTVTEEE